MNYVTKGICKLYLTYTVSHLRQRMVITFQHANYNWFNVLTYNQFQNSTNSSKVHYSYLNRRKYMARFIVIYFAFHYITNTLLVVCLCTISNYTCNFANESLLVMCRYILITLYKYRDYVDSMHIRLLIRICISASCLLIINSTLDRKTFSSYNFV